MSNAMVLDEGAWWHPRPHVELTCPLDWTVDAGCNDETV